MKKIMYVALVGTLLSGSPIYANQDKGHDSQVSDKVEGESQKKEATIIEQLMNVPNKKLIAAALCFVSGYMIPTNKVTRGLGGLGILGNALYAAGGLLSLAWLYEKYEEFMIGVDLMYGMEENINGWSEELRMLRASILDFKEKHRELQSQVAHVCDVTQGLQQGIQDVAALSSDHANLAGIMREVLAQGKKDHDAMAKITQVLKMIVKQVNIDLEDQMLVLEKSAQILSDDDQKVKIVELYNKHGILGSILGNKPQILRFEDIPMQWFKKHDKELTAAGLTVRP